MKHLGTRTITTDRLILRKAMICDADAMYNNWACDTEVTKFLTWQPYTSIEGVTERIQLWINSYDNLDYYHWMICYKEDNIPIGSISVVDKDDKSEMVHIGYCIGKDYWGKGIVTEALGGLIKFFFKEVEVKRVESMCDNRNPASSRVMAKCGMKLEGTLRGYMWSNQGIGDYYVYGLLSSDL